MTITRRTCVTGARHRTAQAHDLPTRPAMAPSAALARGLALSLLAVASVVLTVAATLTAPARAQGSCAGIEIYGPADGQRQASVMDLSQRKIGELGRQRTPLSVVDCEGDLLVIPWEGDLALVLRRDVRTNQTAELPPCPEARINTAQNEYDRSSQGMGGGRLCRKR